LPVDLTGHVFDFRAHVVGLRLGIRSLIVMQALTSGT
jgi:hypothetical protein